MITVSSPYILVVPGENLSKLHSIRVVVFTLINFFIKKLIQNFITEVLSQKLSYSWKRNNTYCILELILFGPVVKLNCDSDCGVGDFIKFGALLHWLIFFGGICSSLQLFANFSWWLRRKEMHQWDWSSSRKT